MWFCPAVTPRRMAITPARSARTWFRVSRSFRRAAEVWRNGSIQRPLPIRPENSATAPRNLLRGPGTWQIDLGAAKRIQLWESGWLEFRSEFYNIFNHPQLGQPQSTFDPSNTTGFGSIINTVNTSIVSPITPVGSGTPREIQFALRLEF